MGKAKRARFLSFFAEIFVFCSEFIAF